MTIHEAQQKLLFQLYHIYDNAEAAAIVNLVMENITDWKKVDRILNKNVPLSNPQLELFEKYSAALMMHEPVQYVLHEAWFCGMKFYVDENVLIPRPETEELVEWIVAEIRSKKLEDRILNSNIQHSNLLTTDHLPLTTHHSQLTIIDIGTGSGCIPIALKKKLPDAKIYSCDISEKALEVAKKNAAINQTEINFLHLDFLDEEKRNALPVFDIIVSNPPYIPITDKKTMQQNVIDFEPHNALFVPDNDPLIFYKAIIEFAKTHLYRKGQIFFEMHEDQSANVKKLFPTQGFCQIEIKKDLQNKNRMLKATMLL